MTLTVYNENSEPVTLSAFSGTSGYTTVIGSDPLYDRFGVLNTPTGNVVFTAGGAKAADVAFVALLNADGTLNVTRDIVGDATVEIPDGTVAVFINDTTA